MVRFVAFDTPGLKLQDLKSVAQYYYSLGYGYVCPTIVTASAEALQNNLSVIREAREHAWGQGILPPHLEGPFLAPECMGAHNPQLRRDPTVEFAEKLIQWSNGFIGWLTMASERPGAVETIRYLTSVGVSVSLGHQNPTIDDIVAGLEAAPPASPT